MLLEQLPSQRSRGYHKDERVVMRVVTPTMMGMRGKAIGLLASSIKLIFLIRKQVVLHTQERRTRLSN